MSAPIAASEVWTAVIRRAAGHCQCPGKNHPNHRHTRCEATADEVRLIAGLSVLGPHPERGPAVLPVEQMRAWCPRCWDEAVKDARRQARAAERAARRAGELEGALW